MTIEGLGKKFQDARIARGLTLDEAARLTKIRPSRLAEIEADDFSQFPSLAYAKGFLQIYGKFLDVDVSPYLDVFETSREVTVDGYSYLQDQPAPKPKRVRTTRAPVVRHRAPRGDRKSPFGLLIAIGVIVLGFILMRLIMNVQRIVPHQMVGVPQQTAAQSAPPQAPSNQALPQQNILTTPAATAAPVAQAPSRAPSSPPPVVAEAPKKVAPPVATAAPSIAIPEALVPAFANANPAAKGSVAPAFANASAAAKVNLTPAKKEPEVRRAEPVRPEDLAKAGTTETTTKTTTQKTTEAQGPNSIAIKPLKKTYIKVVVDNESQQPAFERWISPSDGPVEFHGQKIAVRVLDRDAVRITKNGKPVTEDDDDITVE
jgi:cytoskeletal protein RodZ